MLERTIENAVTKYAREKGWLCFKFTSPGSSGVPDRIMFKKGRTVFIEYKSKHGKLSKLQESCIAELKDNMFEVFVVNDVKLGKDLIDTLESQML